MLRSFVLTTLGALFAAPLGAQTTWYVDDDGTPPGMGTQTDPYTSIQYAIDQSTTIDGDTVRVLEGHYTETVDFKGKAIEIIGVGQPHIDAATLGASAVSFVTGEGPASLLDGFHITGGTGSTSGLGGGVFCSATAPTIRNCRVSGNAATYGGGIACENGSAAAIYDTTVELNVAALGGGVYCDGSNLTLENCEIRSNTVEMQSNVFPSGGGIYAEGSTLTIRRQVPGTSEVSGNRVDPGFNWNGAGICLVSSTSSIVDTTVADNRPVELDCGAGFGGGIFASGGSTYIGRCVVEDNWACWEGGGLAADQATVEQTAFIGNSAQFGGGVFTSSAVLTNCLLTDNAALSLSGSGDSGGGVRGGTLVRCTIEGNIALAFGGGAWKSTLVECLVRDNRTLGEPFGGGGGLAECTATGCEITGNRAFGGFEERGGGAFDCQLERCVIAGNEASAGAGMALCDALHCTVYGNIASLVGGGVFVAAGLPSDAENSILWGNAPDSVGVGVGGVFSATYSDVENGWPGVGNFDLDPGFFDGPSGDFHLLASSPCIDAGNPASPPDSDGSVADVGAFAHDVSYCPVPVSYCTAKENSLGCTPEIASTGSPSVTGADDFHVTASLVVGQQFGLLIWGLAEDSAPFFGGTRCVASPFVRTPVQNTGGTGGTCTGTFDFHFSQPYLAANNLGAGTLVFAQYWQRDPLHPDGTGVGLTGGLKFLTCP